MSIEMENPDTIHGQVDAAANYLQQIRIASMIGDGNRVQFALGEMERLLTLAMEGLSELEIEVGSLRTDLPGDPAVIRSYKLLTGV